MESKKYIRKISRKFGPLDPRRNSDCRNWLDFPVVTPNRRFPPPWSIEDNGTAFVVAKW